MRRADPELKLSVGTFAIMNWLLGFAELYAGHVDINLQRGEPIAGKTSRPDQWHVRLQVTGVDM